MTAATPELGEQYPLAMPPPRRGVPSHRHVQRRSGRTHRLCLSEDEEDEPPRKKRLLTRGLLQGPNKRPSLPLAPLLSKRSRSGPNSRRAMRNRRVKLMNEIHELLGHGDSVTHDMN